MSTVPSFRTWVAGEIVTAAYMNTNVRDAGNFFVAVPIAELRQGTVQSVPNNAFTAISFDVSDIDTDNGHNNVTNNTRYVGKTPGWFQISGSVVFTTNGTGSRGALWAKNGASATSAGVLIAPSGAALNSWIPAKTKHIQLNGTTDYIELQGYQSSGGALNTVVNNDTSGMSVRWVHS